MKTISLRYLFAMSALTLLVTLGVAMLLVS
jgi:hypothetical protein